MFMGPTWGPHGSCQPQMGPMLAPWTLLSGMTKICRSWTRRGMLRPMMQFIVDFYHFIYITQGNFTATQVNEVTYDPLYLHWLTLILPWISNQMFGKVRHGIIYPFSDINDYTVEIWEWIIDFNHTGITLLVKGDHGVSKNDLHQGAGIGNAIVEIRRSYDRLISTMGFPLLIRWHLYIESGSKPQQNIATEEWYAYIWNTFIAHNMFFSG